jgi:hypothetical protein
VDTRLRNINVENEPSLFISLTAGWAPEQSGGKEKNQTSAFYLPSVLKWPFLEEEGNSMFYKTSVIFTVLYIEDCMMDVDYYEDCMYCTDTLELTQ